MNEPYTLLGWELTYLETYCRERQLNCVHTFGQETVVTALPSLGIEFQFKWDWGGSFLSAAGIRRMMTQLESKLERALGESLA